MCIVLLVQFCVVGLVVETVVTELLKCYFFLLARDLCFPWLRVEGKLDSYCNCIEDVINCRVISSIEWCHLYWICG